MEKPISAVLVAVTVWHSQEKEEGEKGREGQDRLKD